MYAPSYYREINILPINDFLYKKGLLVFLVCISTVTLSLLTLKIWSIGDRSRNDDNQEHFRKLLQRKTRVGIM